MPQHPCAEGLSSACFAAYPKWARQVFAYKLLHLLLPKQATRLLPKGLRGIFPNLPPGWQAEWGAPEYLYPGYPPGWKYPEGGFGPPIFVGPWGPGPILGPRSSPVSPEVTPTLLLTQNERADTYNLGDVSWDYLWLFPIDGSLHAQITSVDFLIVRVNNPTDQVLLEIWETTDTGEGIAVHPDGEATLIDGSSIPEWTADPIKTTFQFPDKPIITVDKFWAVAIHRTGAVDPNNFYEVWAGSVAPLTFWRWDEEYGWAPASESHGVYDVYGIAL